MATKIERDHPEGHPKAADFDPHSDEAREWAQSQRGKERQRDHEPGHPAAADTPGQSKQWLPGVDPANPDAIPFDGRPRE